MISIRESKCEIHLMFQIQACYCNTALALCTTETTVEIDSKTHQMEYVPESPFEVLILVGINDRIYPDICLRGKT